MTPTNTAGPGDVPDTYLSQQRRDQRYDAALLLGLWPFAESLWVAPRPCTWSACDEMTIRMQASGALFCAA